MPWFVKIEKGVVATPIFDQHVPAHKDFVRSLIDNGHEAKSGYWAEKGGGMLLFKANDMAEAQAIVANDPLVKFGCVEFELHEWRIVVE